MMWLCCCGCTPCAGSFDDTDTPDLDDDFSTDTTGNYTGTLGGDGGTLGTLTYDSVNKRVYVPSGDEGFFYQEFTLPSQTTCIAIAVEADCYGNTASTSTVGVEIADCYGFSARPKFAAAGDDFVIGEVNEAGGFAAGGVLETFEGSSAWNTGDTLRIEAILDCDENMWYCTFYHNGTNIKEKARSTGLGAARTDSIESPVRVGIRCSDGTPAEWDNLKVWVQDIST